MVARDTPRQLRMLRRASPWLCEANGAVLPRLRIGRAHSRVALRLFTGSKAMGLRLPAPVRAATFSFLATREQHPTVAEPDRHRPRAGTVGTSSPALLAHGTSIAARLAQTSATKA